MLIGSRVGSYEVLGKLGEGGMGEVYRARDTRLDREVALKILPEGFASDPDRLMRFEREARTLASLNHPHIAQVHGIEQDATQSGVSRAIVMELVDGEDLSQRLARGPIPLDEALVIARQIAEALDAAHEAGIIHRDLKPANIKVRADGTVKVLDFGLAKAGGAGGAGRTGGDGVLDSPTFTSPAVTMQGVILGTAAYMAPEQAKGKPVDRRADIWAFGAVLYEMLTGQRAFEGEDITDTIAAVVTREPDWSRLPADTPAAVRRLLLRCLQKDRKHRLRDIGDAHYELGDDSPAAATPTIATAVSRTHRMATAAAALAAILLAVPAISHWREAALPPRPLRLTIDAPINSVRVLSPEISPDGRAVAFASIAAGALGPQLWIRRLDEPLPELAPGPIDATGAPFWSPDGRALAVPSRETLIHVDLASGGTRPLADVRSTLVGISQFSGSWGRDGVILYGLGSTIFRVSEAGGDALPQQLEGIPASHENRFPSFLPDGRRFFFLSREPGGPSTAYVASVDGGPVTRLFAAESQVVYTEPSPGRGYVLFVRDGNLMAQPFDLASLAASGPLGIVARSVPLYAAEFVGTGRGAFSASRDGILVYNSQTEALLQRLVWLDRAGKEAGSVGEPGTLFRAAHLTGGPPGCGVTPRPTYPPGRHLCAGCERRQSAADLRRGERPAAGVDARWPVRHLGITARREVPARTQARRRVRRGRAPPRIRLPARTR
jgi:serine/threonine protein kinase